MHAALSKSLAYLNGNFLPAAEAKLEIFDLAVVQGATVSEMTRTFGQKLFRLEDHLERLFNSLRLVGLEIAITLDELARISQKLVEHNAALAGNGTEVALVHFVSAGEHAMYAGRPIRPGPTVCAHTFPLRFEMWAKKFREGVHLVTPAVRQVPAKCVDPRIKCRSRMHYYLADREARAINPDAVALLLDLEGHVTETNGANFLMVRDGGLVSPPPAKTLAGVSRAMVKQLAARLGIGFSESDQTVDGVLQADEAMLSGTPYCLLPVTRINGTTIGDGRPGNNFQRLIAAWSDEVGIDIARQIGSIDGG